MLKFRRIAPNELNDSNSADPDASEFPTSSIPLPLLLSIAWQSFRFMLNDSISEKQNTYLKTKLVVLFFDT